MANSRIGVENFTVAKMLTDVADGASTYDTPQAFTKKVMSIGISHASNMTPQYADDQVVDIYVDDGDITLNISLTDITEDEKALLMGQTMSAGVRTPSPDDVHPYFAVSFKARKRNGSYKYYKLLKVMFKEPDEELSSKQAAVAPQTDTLSGTGIQRLSDGLRKRVADEDAATWLAATGTGWFTTGDITPDTTPPTVTVEPEDTDTDVAITADIVWTFSEAIQDACVIPANFLLMTAAGVAVAGALSIDETKEIVTFNPTSNLSIATDYIAIAGVGIKDLSGNALAAPSIANFTTTS